MKECSGMFMVVIVKNGCKIRIIGNYEQMFRVIVSYMKNKK